jgi:hypothetical protein
MKKPNSRRDRIRLGAKIKRLKRRELAAIVASVVPLGPDYTAARAEIESHPRRDLLPVAARIAGAKLSKGPERG